MWWSWPCWRTCPASRPQVRLQPARPVLQQLAGALLVTRLTIEGLNAVVLASVPNGRPHAPLWLRLPLPTAGQHGLGMERLSLLSLLSCN